MMSGIRISQPGQTKQQYPQDSGFKIKTNPLSQIHCRSLLYILIFM